MKEEMKIPKLGSGENVLVAEDSPVRRWMLLLSQALLRMKSQGRDLINEEIVFTQVTVTLRRERSNYVLVDARTQS